MFVILVQSIAVGCFLPPFGLFFKEKHGLKKIFLKRLINTKYKKCQHIMPLFVFLPPYFTSMSFHLLSSLLALVHLGDP